MLEQATVLPGTSREDYTATDLVDSDPAGFQEQVITLDFISMMCQLFVVCMCIESD